MIARALGIKLYDKDSIESEIVSALSTCSPQRPMSRKDSPLAALARIISKVFSATLTSSELEKRPMLKWAAARAYDLTVKSDVLGMEGTAEMLIRYIRAFQEKD